MLGNGNVVNIYIFLDLRCGLMLFYICVYCCSKLCIVKEKGYIDDYWI